MEKCIFNKEVHLSSDFALSYLEVLFFFFFFYLFFFFDQLHWPRAFGFGQIQ